MFYITENNKLLNWGDMKYADECKHTDIITQAELNRYPNKVMVVDDELVLNPNFEEEELQKAKDKKYNEAGLKAKAYLESGEAVFSFKKNEETYRIEATDGNIAKIGLKTTALLLAQDYDTTFPWNTKEDINIEINALEGKAIGEGLGLIQDIIWTIRYPLYLSEIERAQTVEEVEAIEIDYSKEEPDKESEE